MRWLALSAVLGWTVSLAAQGDAPALADVLQRAGERVERYFTRAQSLVCLEIVRLMPLTSTWSSEAPTRVVESELRLSWAPDAEGAASHEAQMLRQLLRVNGHAPRRNDWNNCTAPEQQSHETQALSLLLPMQRREYAFTFAGRARVDDRPAVMVDYRMLTPVSVEAHMLEGRDDCVSFNVEGGMRGRLWIDLDTYDVLRMEQHLSGMVEIPLPPNASRHPGAPRSWTLERLDTSIRFKPVMFTNPDETLVLPVSMSSLRITRGSGNPRLRTTTEYTNYRRFLTAGRVVGW